MFGMHADVRGGKRGSVKLYRTLAGIHVKIPVGVRVPDEWTVKDVRRFLRQGHPIVLRALQDEVDTFLEDDVHYGPPIAAADEDGMEEVLEASEPAPAETHEALALSLVSGRPEAED